MTCLDISQFYLVEPSIKGYVTIHGAECVCRCMCGCVSVCVCMWACVFMHSQGPPKPEEAHFVLMVLFFKLSPDLVLNNQHKFLCIVVIQSAFCVYVG